MDKRSDEIKVFWKTVHTENLSVSDFELGAAPLIFKRNLQKMGCSWLY